MKIKKQSHGYGLRTLVGKGEISPEEAIEFLKKQKHIKPDFIVWANGVGRKLYNKAQWRIKNADRPTNRRPKNIEKETK